MSAGPFVYRLGREIFILERAVRFRYGLQLHGAVEQLVNSPLFQGGIPGSSPGSATKFHINGNKKAYNEMSS